MYRVSIATDGGLLVRVVTSASTEDASRPELRREVQRFSWEKFDPRAALLPVPAIVLVLAIGIAAGHPNAAMVMAGGAQSSGFGAYQQPLWFRGGAILAATLGMAVSATLGCLVGEHTIALLTVSVVWAFCYGMAGAISGPMQWVLQQCCTFLVVSSAFSGGVDVAFGRGAGVLAGGCIQFVIIQVLWTFVRPADTAIPDPTTHPPGWRLAALRENFTFDSVVLRFALRLSFIAAVSVMVYRSFDFMNAYWVPMTALLVPKPDKFATLQRDVARVLGTIVGAGFATVLAVAVHPQVWMLVTLVGLFMWAAYALQNVNYAIYVVMLTGYIAFLLAVGRQPETLTVWHRIIATVIGGAIAMMAYFIHRNALLVWRESHVVAAERKKL